MTESSNSTASVLPAHTGRLAPSAKRRERPVYLLFFLIFIGIFVLLLVDASGADAKMNGTVPSNGDDWEYQVLAVNIAAGRGYTRTLFPPLEQYHLDLTSPLGEMLVQVMEDESRAYMSTPTEDFYRAPGFPMLLASTYRIFGEETLNARYMLVFLVLFVAILTTLTGGIWAGTRGIVAGGLAGLMYMAPLYIRSTDSQRVLTEVPATFWMAIFSFWFVLYLKNTRLRYLLLSAVTLTCIIFTRSNIALVFPLLVLYLMVRRVPLRQVAVFGSIVVVPILLWSSYASSSNGKFVAMTTQGEIAFPQFNNMDVIEGIGPDRLFQGLWNPGRILNEDGTLTIDYRNAAQPDENGWIKGFSFWMENPGLVPQLFFVKLRAGFWTRPELAPLYTLGLTMLFLSIGLRSTQRIPLKTQRKVFTAQIALAFAASLLMYGGGSSIYLVVLVIFIAMIMTALLSPYGDAYHPPMPPPYWFLAFIALHFITTLLFQGERFHEPFDPLLCMIAILSMILVSAHAFHRIQRSRISKGLSSQYSIL